jgi:hypothetical protein
MTYNSDRLFKKYHSFYRKDNGLIIKQGSFQLSEKATKLLDIFIWAKQQSDDVNNPFLDIPMTQYLKMTKNINRIMLEAQELLEFGIITSLVMLPKTKEYSKRISFNMNEKYTKNTKGYTKFNIHHALSMSGKNPLILTQAFYQLFANKIKFHKIRGDKEYVKSIKIEYDDLRKLFGYKKNVHLHMVDNPIKHAVNHINSIGDFELDMNVDMRISKKDGVTFGIKKFPRDMQSNLKAVDYSIATISDCITPPIKTTKPKEIIMTSDEIDTINDDKTFSFSMDERSLRDFGMPFDDLLHHSSRCSIDNLKKLHELTKEINENISYVRKLNWAVFMDNELDNKIAKLEKIGYKDVNIMAHMYMHYPDKFNRAYEIALQRHNEGRVGVVGYYFSVLMEGLWDNEVFDMLDGKTHFTKEVVEYNPNLDKSDLSNDEISTINNEYKQAFDNNKELIEVIKEEWRFLEVEDKQLIINDVWFNKELKSKLEKKDYDVLLDIRESGYKIEYISQALNLPKYFKEAMVNHANWNG